MQVGFVLQALQLEPIKVDPGNVAGLKAVAAHVQHFVVILEVHLRELQHRFCPQHTDKSGAQIEDQIALGVRLLGRANRGALLGSFEAKSALVASFKKIAHARRNECSGKGSPDATTWRDLCSVCRQSEVRIRPQVRRDLLSLQFVYIEFSGQQRRILYFEAIFDLLPRQDHYAGWRLSTLRRVLGAQGPRAQRHYCDYIQNLPTHQNFISSPVRRVRRRPFVWKRQRDGCAARFHEKFFE